MYEKILVPLDGSELAEVALPYAEKMAGRVGSEVTLIDIRETAHDDHMHQLYMEKMVEATQRRAEGYLEGSGGQAIKIKSAVLSGHPAEQIVDYADRENMGVIVMATHGWSGIRRWVMGSVADKVLRATKRPVALIRAEAANANDSDRPILVKLLVPLDGSKESEAVIPYVEELASKIEGEVVLLYVVAPGDLGEFVPLPGAQGQMQLRAKAEAYLEKAGNALKGKGIKTTSEVGVGVVAEEIVRVANMIDANIVAMTTHGRSGIGRFTVGSTADKVLNAGKTPLLLVKA